jgi:hypothetical protein
MAGVVLKDVLLDLVRGNARFKVDAPAEHGACFLA